MPLHVLLSWKLESFYLGALGNGFGTTGSTRGAGLGTGTSSSFGTPGAFGAGLVHQQALVLGQSVQVLVHWASKLELSVQVLVHWALELELWASELELSVQILGHWNSHISHYCCNSCITHNMPYWNCKSVTIRADVTGCTI